MIRSIAAAIWFVGCSALHAQAPDVDRITRVAKNFFRDSAELPMEVSVTTVVKGPSGKTKRNKQATIHMLFHGYAQSGHFQVSSRAGIMDRSAMFESMSGDFAAFAAGSLLIKRRDSATFSVEAGPPLLLRIDDRECPEFKVISEKFLFPPIESFCGAATYTLNEDATGGITFQHFHFAAANLPASVQTAELGPAKILTFTVDEDFQSWNMPGETTPFLLPKNVQISVTSDKGTIEFRNAYTPKPEAPKRR